MFTAKTSHEPRTISTRSVSTDEPILRRSRRIHESNNSDSSVVEIPKPKNAKPSPDIHPLRKELADRWIDDYGTVLVQQDKYAIEMRKWLNDRMVMAMMNLIQRNDARVVPTQSSTHQETQSGLTYTTGPTIQILHGGSFKYWLMTTNMLQRNHTTCLVDTSARYIVIYYTTISLIYMPYIIYDIKFIKMQKDNIE